MENGVREKKVSRGAVEHYIRHKTWPDVEGRVSQRVAVVIAMAWNTAIEVRDQTRVQREY